MAAAKSIFNEDTVCHSLSNWGRKYSRNICSHAVHLNVWQPIGSPSRDSSTRLRTRTRSLRFSPIVNCMTKWTKNRIKNKVQIMTTHSSLWRPKGTQNKPSDYSGHTFWPELCRAESPNRCHPNQWLDWIWSQLKIKAINTLIEISKTYWKPIFPLDLWPICGSVWVPNPIQINGVANRGSVHYRRPRCSPSHLFLSSKRLGWVAHMEGLKDQRIPLMW